MKKSKEIATNATIQAYEQGKINPSIFSTILRFIQAGMTSQAKEIYKNNKK